MNIWDRSSVKNGLARTCITKNNYREVPQIYSFCIEHRLIPSFTFVSALGNGIDNWDNLDTSMAQKMWCIDSINRLNNKYHLDISPPESPATCNFTEKSGIGGLLIRADGNIAPCQYFYNKTIGNIYTDEIDDILKHPLITQLYETAQKRREILENSSKCKNCKVKEGCNFGCIGMANDLGNIMSYDGQCDLRVVTTVCYSNRLITLNTNAPKSNSIRTDISKIKEKGEFL